jgi:hypothetical protein
MQNQPPIINEANPPPENVIQAYQLEREQNERLWLINAIIWGVGLGGTLLIALAFLALDLPGSYAVAFILLRICPTVLVLVQVFEPKYDASFAKITELRKVVPLCERTERYRAALATGEMATMEILFEMPFNKEGPHADRISLAIKAGLIDRFRQMDVCPEPATVKDVIREILEPVWHEIGIPILRWHVVKIQTENTSAKGVYY